MTISGQSKKRILRYSIIIITIFLFTYIYNKKEYKTKIHPRDYQEIVKDRTLNVTTEYNPISFFVVGDTVAGFNYDLIQAFAHDKGLKVKMFPMMSFQQRLEGLLKGKYDVIANTNLVTTQLKNTVSFTIPIIFNREVLVQRKRTGKNDSTYIKSTLDLAGRTVYVVKGSPSIVRLQNLEEEIADSIHIKEMDKYGEEQLIDLVSHGVIDYAICHESIAKNCADSLSEIDIQRPISFTQIYAWAVNKQSPILLDSLNTWLETFIKSNKYKKIYLKYYKK